jgi:hypothetical protein
MRRNSLALCAKHRRNFIFRQLKAAFGFDRLHTQLTMAVESFSSFRK